MGKAIVLICSVSLTVSVSAFCSTSGTAPVTPVEASASTVLSYPARWVTSSWWNRRGVVLYVCVVYVCTQYSKKLCCYVIICLFAGVHQSDLGGLGSGCCRGGCRQRARHSHGGLRGLPPRILHRLLPGHLPVSKIRVSSCLLLSFKESVDMFWNTLFSLAEKVLTLMSLWWMWSSSWLA